MPIWWIIALSLLVRATFAAILPLGTDEAYALAVGRAFSISFFDHPPLGFWAPAAVEWLLGSNAPFVLRLPSLILGSIALWGFYLTGRALGGEKAGVWTASLAALAPMVAFSGVMILPDAPLYPALIFAVFALIRLAQGQGGGYWALGGVSLALALASKYQAGLLPISLLIWMVSSHIGRGWFLRPGFYLALGLSLLGLLPVLWWNVTHDWASFAFHSGRAGGGFAPDNFALMALGQAIYLLPPILVLATLAVFNPAIWHDPVRRMVLMIGLGPILAFNAIYMVSQNSLAHWTMAGWIMILPLLRLPRGGLGWLIGFGVPIYGLGFVVALHLATGVLTPNSAPNWDQTAPMIPMQRAQSAIAQSSVLQGADFIAARDWIQAGHLAAAIGPSPVMRVLSDRPHHFAYMGSAAGTGVLLEITTLSAQDSVTADLLAYARQRDPNAELLAPILIPRGGQYYFAVMAIRLTLP